MFRPARKRVERRGSAPGTLKVPGVENARDLGGIPTAGGLTAYHRYLRCGSTSSLSKSDVQALRAYGVSVVVDLRSKEEVAASPDSLAHRIGVRYRNIPLYSRNIHDPKLERPGDDIGELSFMRSAYLSMLANRDAVRDIMLFMAPAKHDECVLFHCAAGMDRTGVVAMLLLGLAGASRTNIVRDYLRSFAPEADVDEVVCDHPDRRDDLALLSDALGGAYDRLLATYDSIPSYLAVCGVDEPALARLRRHFCE